MGKGLSFSFKNFTISQKTNSQKVGTDSMLLGAWAPSGFKSILDIGTGTGILALMCAQKNPDAEIIAIEPDEDQCREANQNFNQSPYSKRIRCFATRLQNFHGSNLYDLIISNPPYFENSTLSVDLRKNNVRHTLDLTSTSLYEHAVRLLQEQGKMCVIIPFENEASHLREASEFGLYANKILRTKREDGEFKRSLILFGRTDSQIEISSLLVKDSQNRYSAEYIDLTKEFYAKDLHSIQNKKS